MFSGDTENNYMFNAKFGLHVSTLLNLPNASISVDDLEIIDGKMTLSQYLSMSEQIENCYLNKHEVTGLDISDESIDDEQEFDCEGKIYLTFTKSYCHDYGCYEYDMNASIEITSFKKKNVLENIDSWKIKDDLFYENKRGTCYVRMNRIRGSDKFIMEIGHECFSHRKLMSIERFTDVWFKVFSKETDKD